MDSSDSKAEIRLTLGKKQSERRRIVQPAWRETLHRIDSTDTSASGLTKAVP